MQLPKSFTLLPSILMCSVLNQLLPNTICFFKISLRLFDRTGLKNFLVNFLFLEITFTVLFRNLLWFYYTK